MNKNEPVSSIMTREVITIQETENLFDIATIFKKKHIRHLPVLKGEKVTGILSRTDINRLSYGALLDNEDLADEAILNMLTVPQVMSGDPKSVKTTDSIKEVAEIFVNSEFHALPVVNNGNIEGIVTTTDVIRYLLEQY